MNDLQSHTVPASSSFAFGASRCGHCQLDMTVAVSAEPVGSTPDRFGAHLKSEIAKWERVIKR
jgi:hypothetical protein